MVDFFDGRSGTRSSQQSPLTRETSPSDWEKRIRWHWDWVCAIIPSQWRRASNSRCGLSESIVIFGLFLRGVDEKPLFGQTRPNIAIDTVPAQLSSTGFGL